MNIVYGFENLPALSGAVITIGAFDGVHLGHQGLIQQTLSAARRRALPTWVLTFDPLPRQVFSQGKRKLLTTLPERLKLITALGVEGILVMRFDDALIQQRADDFVAHIAAHLKPVEVWVGKDFRFGARQEGDVSTLRTLSPTLNFTVGEFDEVVWGGLPVRSSRIRAALRSGNLTEANACLGRPYYIAGTVGHGDQRGRTLGFPTANLIADDSILIPANGVYVCQVHLGQHTYQAITNVGTRPTFNNRPATVEAHLLDFNGDIYDQTITVDFLHYLRPELKFDSARALIEQMCEDRHAARQYFSQDRR